MSWVKPSRFLSAGLVSTNGHGMEKLCGCAGHTQEVDDEHRK